MKKSWEDNFDALLAWLDPDRESAGRKYEEIRHALILIFEWRGCCDAEDLADETITRVMNKVPEIATGYTGDPALYFFAVAKRLSFEVSRRQQVKHDIEHPENLPGPAINEEPRNHEAAYECLDECMGKLSSADRELILLYYQQEQPTIRYRRELAQRYDLAPNALRVKVHRIRATLHGCVKKCLAERSDAETE